MFTFSNVGDLDRGLKDLYDWTTSSVKEAYGVAVLNRLSQWQT